MLAVSARLALVGAGASALYLLQNLLDQGAARLFGAITVFEKRDRPGMGMPYNPATTDRFNLCNISSEELPPLSVSFVDWLRGLDDGRLAGFHLQRDQIDASETYGRVVLGEYFEEQFQAVVAALRTAGLDVEVRVGAGVVDLVDHPEHGTVEVVLDDGARETFGRVVTATGHRFTDGDRPQDGYFESPWPIGKVLPKEGKHFDFTVGLLGASLSAFDVVSSLSHRHGRFDPVGDDGQLRFVADEGADGFRIAMHSSNGWLPHLQYAQKEPMRQVYRHVGQDEVLALRDEAGLLRLDTYFDRVCRPALAGALRHDGLDEVADAMENGMSLDDLVETLGEDHTYEDAFEGMREELPEARRSLDKDRPIRWKEVLDDLMYTLNYHAELMPAEDHRRLHAVVMPFLMNVIAAMPLPSARILLALRDAGRLELVKGRLTVEKVEDGTTSVSIDDDGEVTTREYRLFVECGGQPPVTIEDYPFRSLVDDGTVTAASVRSVDGGREELAGIAIDPGYRVLDETGEANRRIVEIAFPHTLGLRPYSYGLQACNHTAAMVVATWIHEDEEGKVKAKDVETFIEIEAGTPDEA